MMKELGSERPCRRLKHMVTLGVGLLGKTAVTLLKLPSLHVFSEALNSLGRSPAWLRAPKDVWTAASLLLL